MAVNKVVYGENTLVDLTEDTVTADKLLSGYSAHSASGEKLTGTLAFVTCYIRSDNPDNSVGNIGDIWIKVVE